MDKQMGNVVVIATLNNDYVKLTGTDLTDEEGIVPGNNVSILIQCSSFREREHLVHKLKAGNNPVINTDRIVNIVDRYRVNWIFTVSG